MAIVRQYSKRSNTTYVYEASYRWDPELKQSRSVRKLIGKVDEATGEVIPTSGKPGRPRKDKSAPDNSTAGKSSSVQDAVNELKRELKEKDAVISSLREQIRMLNQSSDEQRTLIIRNLKALIDKLEV